MKRRTAIKSIVLAALGVVGKKKPEVFVVELDANTCPEPHYYRKSNGKIHKIKLPEGRWQPARIVFEKVDG